MQGAASVDTGSELLDQLETLMVEERQALLQRDWPGLQGAVSRKERLAQSLARLTVAGGSKDQLLRLRHATQHNAELARNLSEQVATLVRRARPGSTYTRGARLYHKPRTMMHRVG